MACVYGNGGCFVKPPHAILLFFCRFLCCWWIEINCRWWHRSYIDWSTGNKNILLWVSQNSDVHLSLPFLLFLLLFTFFSFSYSPTFFRSSLFSPPLLLSRAVMGLDRESDVVHIETRIGKGREYCTPVCCSSKTHRTPCLSFRARSQARWDLFFCSDWSLKSSKAE